MTFGTKMSKLKSRLMACWYAFKYQHFFIVGISTPELIKYFKDEECNPEIIYAGLRPYNLKSIIIQMADSIDKDELILEKAEFQYKAEQLGRTKPNP